MLNEWFLKTSSGKVTRRRLYTETVLENVKIFDANVWASVRQGTISELSDFLRHSQETHSDRDTSYGRY